MKKTSSTETTRMRFREIGKLREKKYELIRKRVRYKKGKKKEKKRKESASQRVTERTFLCGSIRVAGRIGLLAKGREKEGEWFL